MKYTRLFGDIYNEIGDNIIPDEFNLIPNASEGISFKDMFVLEYLDKEIGFETEELFTLKLAGKAKLLCPHYAERIANIAKYAGVELHTVTVKHDGSNTLVKSGTKVLSIENGKAISSVESEPTDKKTFTIPNPVNATLDNIDEIASRASDGAVFDRFEEGKKTQTEESHTDTHTENYNGIMDTETLVPVITESGYSTAEAFERMRYYEHETRNIYKDLLNEFKSLFMLVY